MHVARPAQVGKRLVLLMFNMLQIFPVNNVEQSLVFFTEASGCSHGSRTPWRPMHFALLQREL